MAQPPLHLVIGNYNTSSWSLRAWLVLRLARLAFIETRIPLRMAESPGQIAAVSPSGKLPVLLAEGVPIWDSLAIAEFVAELEPGIWPLDPIARAEARAISAEMHCGFADLRRLMPMDVIGRFSPPGRLPRGLAADIDRIKAIWGHCRARFAPHGPFLFGAFSIADCMMAPVATRLVTHGVPIDGLVEDYVDSVMSWPDMVTWCNAAAEEQAEREAHGTVGVLSITRPGRVLGREAADPAVMPAAPKASAPPPAVEAAAPPSQIEPERVALDLPPGDDVAGREVEEAKPPTGTPSAALLPSTGPEILPLTGSSEDDSAGNGSGDDGDDARVPAPAEPATPPLVIEVRGAEPPATGAVAFDQPAHAGQPPTRRRLFESAASVEAVTPANSGVSPPDFVPPTDTDAAPAPYPADVTRVAPSASDRLAPASDGDGSRPPAPKLGWIRRPVPAEHMAETEPPAADEALPAPFRQPAAPTRPSSPAVKPIGGGILRRR